MTLALFFHGLIIGLLVASPIGAPAIMCVQRTINKGFWPGFLIGIGSALADYFYAIVAGFSIQFIMDFLFDHRQILAFFGGILMIFFGIKIFRSNPIKQIRERHEPIKKSKYFSDIAASFGLTISNPLTILAFGGLFATTGGLSKSSSFSETVLILFGVIIGAILWWFLLVSLINFFRKKIRLKHIFLINRITGVCVMIFGISMLCMAFFYDKQ